MDDLSGFLRIGDRVSLIGDGGGYAAALGGVQVKPYQPGIDYIPSSFHDCVFTIVAMRQYQAAKKFETIKQALHTPRGSWKAPGQEEVRLYEHMKAEAETEKEQNLEESKRFMGKECSYGQVVQLVHAKSGKFVTMEPKAHAVLDKAANKIILSETGSEGSWFSIEPRYKIHQEGEKVHLGDKVCFVSYKQHHFIAPSALKFENGNAEVMAQTDQFAWQINIFSPYNPKADRFLKGSDVIRVFHPETKGYLSAEESVDTKTGALQLFLKVSRKGTENNSANALWEVQHESPDSGNIASFNKSFRLRHLSTGLFLSVGRTRGTERFSATLPALTEADDVSAEITNKVPTAHSSRNFRSSIGDRPRSRKESNAEEIVTYSLQLVEDGHLSQTLFSIHPVYEMEGPIKCDDVVKLKSVGQRAWIHAIDEFLDVRTDIDHSVMVGETGAAKTKQDLVCTTKDYALQDAFVIKPAEVEEIEDLQYVDSLIPSLQKYLSVWDRVPIDPKNFNNAKETLTNLIIFCSMDDNYDPLTRTGLPIRGRQKLLKEQKIIDFVVEMLRVPFLPGRFELADVLKPENAELFLVCKLCYRFLMFTLMDYPKNGLYMAKHISFMQSQLGYQMKTADTLLALFKDNKRLLQGVQEDQITYFINLIKTKGRLARYMNFLMCLCSCNDKGVRRNQDIVTKRLLVENPDLLWSPVNENDVLYLTMGNGNRVTLADFMASSMGETKAYVEGMIRLLGRLCMSRNEASMAVITKWLTFRTIEKAVFNEKYPPGVRAAFVDCMYYMYVDADPLEKYLPLKYTRIWDELDDRDSDHMSRSDMNQQFMETKLETLKYLNENAIQIVANVQENKLTLNLLKLLNGLLDFGCFASLRELDDFIPTLVNMIDGTQDKLRHESVVQFQIELQQTQSRKSVYTQDPETLVTMQCKIEAAKALEFIWNVRLNDQLTKCLLVYKNSLPDVEDRRKQQDFVRSVAESIHDFSLLDQSEISRISRESRARAPSKQEQELMTEALLSRGDTAEKMNKVSKVIGMDSKFDRDRIVKVMLHLTMYHNVELNIWGFNLLVRLFRSQHDLLQNLRRVQLLISDSAVAVYKLAQELLVRVQQLLQTVVTEKSEVELTEIIESLIGHIIPSEYSNPNQEVQRLLHNLDAHEKVIEILRLPFTNDLPREQKRRELFIICYRFLRVFCIDNPENKAALFNHLDFFLSQMGVKLKAADTINEIFKDNRVQCSQLSDRTVRHFLDLIEERGKFARYLNFLSSVVVVEGKGLKRNQTMVIKCLSERRDSVVELFDDPEGMKRRAKLLKEGDLENEDGLINYHISLLDLLHNCAEGKNDYAEFTIQSLLPIATILRQMKDQDCAPIIKEKMAQLLAEVYFLTEKPVKGLAALPEVFGVLEEFKLALVEAIAPDYEPDSQSVGYLVDGIIYCLTHFYDRVFSAPAATNENLDRATEVATLLVDLCDRPWLNPVQRDLVVKSIHAARKSEIVSDKLRQCAETHSIQNVRKIVRAKSHRTVEMDIASEFNRFMKSMQKNFGSENEFTDLVDLFVEKKDNTKRIMTQMWNFEQAGSTKLTVACLKILQTMLERPETPGELTSLQDEFNSYGIPPLLVQLVSRGKDELVKEGLILANLMLENGNPNVQASLLESFRSHAGEVFFEQIRARMRRGMVELKERKKFMKLQLDKLEAAREANPQDENAASQHRKSVMAVYQMRASEVDIQLQSKSDGPEEQEQFQETGYLNEVLRFIQLCCEGHNLQLQNYLRNQTQSVRSIDLVTETSSCLFQLEKYISGDNLEVVTQCLDTLTELMQGPCHDNQVVLANSKLCETVNKLLRLPELSEDASILAIKAAAAKTLMSMLEGREDPNVARRMTSTLNVEHVGKTLNQYYSRLKEGEASEETEESAYLFFFLLKVLQENSPDKERFNEIFDNFDGDVYMTEGSGRIEILRGGRLERVYFPIPKLCHHLTQQSMEDLKWNVARDSPVEKIMDFYERSEDLIFEMEVQESLSRSGLFRFMKRSENLSKNVFFFLSVLINLIMLWFYEAPSEELLPRDLDDPHTATLETTVHDVILVLGIIHFLASLNMFAVYALIYIPNIARKAWEANAVFKLPIEERHNAPKWKHWVTSAWSLAQQPVLTFYCAFAVFSLLGITTRFYFFSVHLLDIIIRNPPLHNVIKAVTKNGYALFLTFLLGMVVIYLFAVAGFIGYRERYFDDDAGYMCRSLLQCFTNTFSYGLRAGDLGEIMPASEWSDPKTLSVVLLQVGFFILVTTILMNVIFGIIIDTFAELRDLRQSIREDMLDRCFICGIERSLFDRHADGFEAHIKMDHNMWAYLQFLVHLRTKDPNEYTGPEQFVADQLSDESDIDLGFFPIHKALALDKHSHEDDENARKLDKLQEDMEKIESHLVRLDKLLDKQAHVNTN